VDFFDADGLACEDSTEVDFFVTETDAPAAGDDDGFVMERVSTSNCPS
jgi:hypothetical protein